MILERYPGFNLCSRVRVGKPAVLGGKQPSVTSNAGREMSQCDNQQRWICQHTWILSPKHPTLLDSS